MHLGLNQISSDEFGNQVNSVPVYLPWSRSVQRLGVAAEILLEEKKGQSVTARRILLAVKCEPSEP